MSGDSESSKLLAKARFDLTEWSAEQTFLVDRAAGTWTAPGGTRYYIDAEFRTRGCWH